MSCCSLRSVTVPSRSGDTGEEGDVSNICDDAHKDAPRQAVIDR